ncbi:MAG: ATP-binding protein [bacterium]
MTTYNIISCVINSLVAISLAFYVFFKNPKSRLHQTFGLFNLFVGLWSAGYLGWLIFGIAPNDPIRSLWWARFFCYGYMPIVLFFYHYVLCYVNKQKNNKKSLFFLYGFTIFFLIMAFNPFFIQGVSSRWYMNFWADAGPLYYPYTIVIMFFTLYGTSILYSDYKQSSGLRKKQSQYLFLGMAIGFTFGYTNYFPYFPYLKEIPPFGTVLVSACSWMAAYAIIRYRLMDIYFAIGKTTIYFFSYLSLFLLIFSSANVIKIFANPFWQILLTAVTTVIFVLLFDYIFKFYEKIAGEYFYYDIYIARKNFGDINAKLPQIIDLNQFSRAIKQILQDSFHSPSVKIDLIIEKNNPILPLAEKTRGVVVSKELPLLACDPAFSLLKTAIAEIQSRMNEQKIEIYVPLLFQGEAIGLISLGEKPSKIFYSKEEIQLIESFSYQAAIVLKNVLLFEQLKNINTSLEEKVLERTKNLEAEKNRTTAIVANLIDGLLFFGADKKLILANPQAEAFLENGKNANLLFGLLEGEKKIFRQETPISEKLILEISTVPIMASKKTSGTLMILHDVTREKMIEKMKTEFVSIAAHQLRTPLSAIKWSLNFLKQGDAGELNDEQKNLIEKSRESNERMIVLINDLLDVAKIEEGRYLCKLSPAKLESLARTALDSRQELAVKLGVKVKLAKPKNPLPEIMLDSEKIIMTMQNLIENAIKYTKKDGQVEISIEQSDDKIKFSVKDNGIGISKKQQERLFTKFFRSSGAITMETDGSGLGLFIAKNIIEAHGGKIWCESEENKGSIFSFILPIKPKDIA